MSRSDRPGDLTTWLALGWALAATGLYAVAMLAERGPALLARLGR